MDASATGRPRREATWMLDAERTTFHGSPEGSVELVTPGEDARAALRSVFDAWRVRQVGEIRRRDHSLGLRARAARRVLGTEVERLPGHPPQRRRRGGRLRALPAEERWEQRQPRNTLQVDELHGLTTGSQRGVVAVPRGGRLGRHREGLAAQPVRPAAVAAHERARGGRVGRGRWDLGPHLRCPTRARDTDVRSGDARRPGGHRRRGAGRPHPSRPRCRVPPAHRAGPPTGARI